MLMPGEAKFMVRGSLRIVALLCALALASAARAADSARVALLIGNQAYARAVGPLAKPAADIEAVGAVLERLGFSVTKLADAGKAQMDTAIKGHARRVREAGSGAISFFYYSGHGVVNPDTNVNYLIPVDVADPDAEDVWDRAIEQRLVIDLLSERAANATHFVVFDACRSELSIAGKAGKALGADKGFVPLADVRGMLIAYSTAAKKTAADTGQFAKILAESLQLKIPATHAFLEMQARVVKTMRQEPWLSMGYVPPVYLAGVETAPASADKEAVAARDWAAVDKNSAAMLRTFLALHGESGYAVYAIARLNELLQGLEGVPAYQLLPGGGGKHELAKPAAAAVPPPPACDGLLVTVATGDKPCIKPGSGAFFKDCPDCPEMVIAPAGRFTMGSPENEPEHQGDETQHEVRFAKPFAVGRFAVTFAEWEACVADAGCGGYRPADEGWGRDDRPVINVNWNDAKLYVQWLSAKTGKQYRLLSEPEREYVARAGTVTPFWWGSSITPAQANYDGSAKPYKGAVPKSTGGRLCP
jgi:formylglycine-generating enzyme required for sulfatase activity